MHAGFGTPAGSGLSYDIIGGEEGSDAVRLGNDGYLLRADVSGGAGDTLDTGYEAWFLLDSWGQFEAAVKGPILDAGNQSIPISVDMFDSGAVYLQALDATLNDGQPVSSTGTEVFRIDVDDLAQMMIDEYADGAGGHLIDLLAMDDATPVAAFAPGDFEGTSGAVIVEGGVLAGTDGIHPDHGPQGTDYEAFILTALNVTPDFDHGDIELRFDPALTGSHIAWYDGSGFTVETLTGFLMPDPNLFDVDPDDPNPLDAVTEIFGTGDAEGLITGFQLRVEQSTGDDNIVYYDFDFATRTLSEVPAPAEV